MDPDRLTVYQYLVSLSKGLRIDQHQWLAEEAKKHDRSPSGVLREVVDAYRKAQADLEPSSETGVPSPPEPAGDGSRSASEVAHQPSNPTRLSLPEFPSIHEDHSSAPVPGSSASHAADTGSIQSFLETYHARLQGVDSPPSGDSA